MFILIIFSVDVKISLEITQWIFLKGVLLWQYCINIPRVETHGLHSEIICANNANIAERFYLHWKYWQWNDKIVLVVIDNNIQNIYTTML